MKYLLVPDKFKGSATAHEVVGALAQGIKQSQPEATIHTIIASDGGDGFLDCIAAAQPIERISAPTQNALQQPITADFGFDPATKTAYIELAQASGLAQLAGQSYSILKTSTFGTGRQIQQALAKGAQHLVLGLGGSATNDAGMGIASALGVTFLDVDGKPIEPCSGNLLEIHQLFLPVKNPLEGIGVTVVNDVTNPLLGPRGAVATYAPQKGATAEEMTVLEKGLQQLAQLLDAVTGGTYSTTPGTGAAGGTAYGMTQLFSAKLCTGAEFLLEYTPLAQWVANERYTYIITGEGAWDEQSLQGKVVGTVCLLAAQHHIPVVIVCGTAAVKMIETPPAGVQKVLPLKTAARSASYCIKNAKSLIASEIAVFLNQKAAE